MINDIQLDKYIDELKKCISGSLFDAIELFEDWIVNKNIYNQVLNGTYFLISFQALRDALEEIALDIRFMVKRRNLDENILPGKIAGIILFRLVRWNIIGIRHTALVEQAEILQLIYLIPFAVAINYIDVNFNDVDKIIRTEVLYSLMRRHTNQETLGLVLDTIRHYVKK